MNHKLLQQALDALEEIHVGNMTHMAEENWNEALTALRQALAQPEQELDCGEAGHDEGRCGNFHCITKPVAPPKRQWVGLTEDEMHLMCHNDDDGDWNDLQQRRFWRETYLAGAKAAQDELKKRNT